MTNLLDTSAMVDVLAVVMGEKDACVKKAQGLPVVAFAQLPVEQQEDLRVWARIALERTSKELQHSLQQEVQRSYRAGHKTGRSETKLDPEHEAAIRNDQRQKDAEIASCTLEDCDEIEGGKITNIVCGKNSAKKILSFISPEPL